MSKDTRVLGGKSSTVPRAFTRTARLSDDELRRIEAHLTNLATQACTCGHIGLEIQKDLMAIPTPTGLVMPAILVICPRCGSLHMYSSESLGVHCE